MIDPELLEVMVCPLCRAEFDHRDDRLHCTREACGCSYRIEDGIPIALIEEANRSCPDCGTRRDWDPASEELSCPECGSTFQRSA